MKKEDRPGRKRLLLNRPYQIRFMVEIMAVVVLATCATTISAHILLSRGVESGFYSVHRSLTDIRQLIVPVIFTTGLITFAAMALLGAYITLRETHRVIGPARKMEKKFMEMSEGDFTLMTSFRRGDVLKGLDNFINIHLNTMSDYFTILDMSIEELRTRAQGLKSGDEDPQEAADRLAVLADRIARSAEDFKRGA